MMKILSRSMPLVLVAALLAVAPQSGTMMQGGDSGSCPMMNGMMQSAHGPADQMMMNGMMQMHHGMASTQLTGDADKDFVTMMIPHHQAAIDMAKAELQYGKDPRAIALAKSIIAAQQKEIDEMQSWSK